MTEKSKRRILSLDQRWEMFSDDLDRVQQSGGQPYEDPLLLKRLLVSAAEHLQSLAVHPEPSQFQENIVWKFRDLIDAATQEKPGVAKSNKDKIAAIGHL